MLAALDETLLKDDNVLEMLYDDTLKVAKKLNGTR